MYRSIAATVFVLGLAGCAAPVVERQSAPPKVKHADLAPICLKVKKYSSAERATLAAAIEQLDKNSPIIPAMGDYKRMRDEARACTIAAH